MKRPIFSHLDQERGDDHTYWTQRVSKNMQKHTTHVIVLLMKPITLLHARDCGRDHVQHDRDYAQHAQHHGKTQVQSNSQPNQPPKLPSVDCRPLLEDRGAAQCTPLPHWVLRTQGKFHSHIQKELPLACTQNYKLCSMATEPWTMQSVLSPMQNYRKACGLRHLSVPNCYSKCLQWTIVSKPTHNQLHEHECDVNREVQEDLPRRLGGEDESKKLYKTQQEQGHEKAKSRAWLSSCSSSEECSGMKDRSIWPPNRSKRLCSTTDERRPDLRQ